MTVTVVGGSRYKVERRARVLVLGVRVTISDNKHDKGVSFARAKRVKWDNNDSTNVSMVLNKHNR